MKTIAKKTDVGFGKKVYLLGIDKDGQKVWLEEPKWDCDWYWGFGYIERYRGNRWPSNALDISSHSHWDSIIVGMEASAGKYIHHLNDNPEFAKTTLTDSESWELADLMKTFYTLQDMAKIYNLGGSHVAQTAISLKSKKDEDHINQVLLPKVFKRIDEILSPDATSEKDGGLLKVMTVGENLMNAKVSTINQANLSAECWLIQFSGPSACTTCPSRDTDECGG